MARKRVRRPLKVERCQNGSRTLLEDLEVDVSGTTMPKWHTVGRGSPTDYSSLPWGLRWLVNWSRVDVSGVVHDDLYRKCKPQCSFSCRLEMERVWCRVARSGQHRANWLQAGLGFAGLVLGGWCTIWDRCTWGHIVLSVFIDLVVAALLGWVAFLIGERTGLLVLVLGGIVVVTVNLWQRR